jgi:hypothetical protein
MSEQSYNSRGEVLEFTNTYLHYTVEGGTGQGQRSDRVTAVRGENVTLILVESGALRVYLDIDTAISLASGILAVAEAEVDR